VRTAPVREQRAHDTRVKPATIENVSPSLLLSGTLKAETCRTVILPLVLYDCQTCSPILREEHRLRAFENRMLREILGPKMERVARGGRILCNEEFHNVYSLQTLLE
jgi:hypothetical protein